MTMDENVLIPRQPYMVMLTDNYDKKVILQYGISHFYQYKVKVGIDRISNHLPDACLDLFFYTDDSHSVFGAEVIDSPEKATSIRFKENYEYFGVRFLPGYLPEFICNKVSEIKQSDDSCIALFGPIDVIKNILMPNNFEDRIDKFMEYYIPIYQSNSKESIGNKRVYEYMVSRYNETNGNIKLTELSLETNYSGRYLNKVFSGIAGMSPKQFGKIVRFQKAVQGLEMGNTVSQVTYDLGYFDTAHMIKDFKELSGRKPSQFIDDYIGAKIKERIKIY